MKSELKIEMIVDLLIYYTVDIILMVFYKVGFYVLAYALVVELLCFLKVDKVFFHVVSDGWGLASERGETSACFALAYRNPCRFMYVI